jgi:hypothetical protein
LHRTETATRPEKQETKHRGQPSVQLQQKDIKKIPFFVLQFFVQENFLSLSAL